MPVGSTDIRAFWFKSNASIPDQWSEDTDGSERYFQGEDDAWDPDVDPTTGGGAHTHTQAATHTHASDSHTHTFSAGAAIFATSASVVHATIYAGVWCDVSHSHSGKSAVSATLTYSTNTISIANATHNYPYLNVVLLKPSSVDVDVPPDALVFGDSATPPEGYANISGHGDYVAGWNNKFLRGTTGSGDGGSTGGDANHNHSFTHTAVHTVGVHMHSPVDANPGAAVDTDPPGRYPVSVRVCAHHSVFLNDARAGSLVNTTHYSADNTFEPAWIKLLGIYNSSGRAQTPVGIIVGFVGESSDIPSGWTLCDGAGGTLDCTDKHAKMTADTGSIGDTGGDNNHTHTSSHGHVHSAGHTHTVGWIFTGGSVNAEGGVDHSCMNYASDLHSHTWTVTSTTPTVQNASVNFNSSDGRAAYLNLLWIKRTAVSEKRPTCGTLHGMADMVIAA